ncbi:FUSC family protein [Halorubrum rubrum]|uniref:FUSC family protein n=1 Tax=Halorubrum rubrum TaxID=1126240 RepID=A0ABD5R2Z9_9EURY|nr:FUSC family protein [Halorubrum rubrum]
MRALSVFVAALLLVSSVVAGIGPAGATADARSASQSTVPDPASQPTVSDPASQPTVSGPVPPATGSVGSRAVPTSTHGENLTLRVLSTPPGVEPRIASHRRGVNLGTSLGLAVGDSDAALRTEAAIRRIESAETNAERQRRILAEINEVEQGEVSLDSRQTTAINAHASGELTDRELLDELVRIAALAREYDRRLETLSELAEGTDGFSTPDRVSTLQVQLQVYEGPVREVALETVRGDRSGTEIHVQSSRNAMVLATIVDGHYVRESLRRDQWDRGGDDLGSEAAINATVEAYPETTDLREANALGAGTVQRITVDHDFGTLRTFVSGGTERVFLEHQRMALSTFPDAESVSTAEDGFNVTVNRTYPGGPVTVTVLDSTTGDPLEGITVTKSAGGTPSETIGSTDEDGVVRTLSPADPYRITVVDEPRVAVIDDIDPIRTPRVADDVENEDDANDSA